MVRLVSLPIFAVAASSLGEIVDANSAAKQKGSSVSSTGKEGSASQGPGDYINYNYLMSSGKSGSLGWGWSPYMKMGGGSPSGGYAQYMGSYTGWGSNAASKSGGQGGGYQQYVDKYGNSSKYMGGMGLQGGQSGGSPGGDYSHYMGGSDPPGGKSGGSPGGNYNTYTSGSSITATTTTTASTHTAARVVEAVAATTNKQVATTATTSQGGQGGDMMKQYGGGVWFMAGGAGPKVVASATSPVAADLEGSDKGAAGAATLLAESDRDSEGRRTNLTVVAWSFVAFGWLGLLTFARQRGRSAITDPLLQSEVVGARGPMHLEA